MALLTEGRRVSQSVSINMALLAEGGTVRKSVYNIALLMECGCRCIPLRSHTPRPESRSSQQRLHAPGDHRRVIRMLEEPVKRAVSIYQVDIGRMVDMIAKR